MAKKVRIKDSWIIRLLGGLFLKAKGFKVGDKYKAKKGEKIIILSNHVTNYDPMFVRYSTNRFCYTLGTDTALSTRIGRFWLPRLGIIPKKKGIADILKDSLSFANSKTAGRMSLEAGIFCANMFVKQNSAPKENTISFFILCSS